MPVILKNNAFSTLATAITASDTAIVVANGNQFPALSAGEYFYATLVSPAGTIEIIKVTARVSNSLTVVRAQDGSSANSFQVGALVDMRVNAASINELRDEASEISIADAGGYYTATDVEGALQEAAQASTTKYNQGGVGSATRTVQGRLRDFVSVKDFGAIGDGVADDTAAIQAAIDTLTAHSTLYLPEGSYLVSYQTKDATHQSVSAWRALKWETDDTKIVADNAQLLIDAEDLPSDGAYVITLYVTSDNCQLDGLKITSVAGTKPTTAIVTGIEVDSVDNFVGSNLTVGALGGGVRLRTCTYSYIRTSNIYDCFDTGFNGWGGCLHCAIEDSVVTNSGDGNCTFFGSNFYCSISRCYFKGGIDGGSQLGVIESSHYSTLDGCFFDGSDGNANNGPIMNRCRFSSLKNNKVVGMQYGVIVRETDIAGAGGIPNWAAVVSGNEIRDTQQRIANQQPTALWLEYTSSVLVEGNTFIRTTTALTAGAREIRLLNRGGYSTGERECQNLRITNNTFFMRHGEVGFGSFSDYHPIVLNDTGAVLRRFSFDNNTIVSPREITSTEYLLQLGTASNVSICGNTVSDNNTDLGPARFVKGTLSNATISNNVLGFFSTNGSYVLKLDGCNRVVVNANVFDAGRAGNPGSPISVASSASRIVVSNNIVNGCSRFIGGDNTESDIVVLGNMVDYDFASQYSNVTPSIDQNNTFTNY